MYVISLITDRYIGNVYKRIVGYKETEDEAREYCTLKTNIIRGSSKKYMGTKYSYEKIELLKD